MNNFYSCYLFGSFSLCRLWTTKAKRKDGSIDSKISLERPNYYLQNSKYLQKSSAQWKGSFNIFFSSFHSIFVYLYYYTTEDNTILSFTFSTLFSFIESKQMKLNLTLNFFKKLGPCAF